MHIDVSPLMLRMLATRLVRARLQADGTPEHEMPTADGGQSAATADNGNDTRRSHSARR